MKVFRVTSALFAVVALMVGGPAHTRFKNVGNIDFPTSATEDAGR